MPRARMIGVSAALFLSLAAGVARADGRCHPGDGADVWLTAGVAAAAGVGAALGSSGALVAADDRRDYAFASGALAGGGVALGLAGVYGLFDHYTGCRMVQRSGGFVWSVPIVTFVIGAVLPVAIWGAAGEKPPDGFLAASHQPSATGDPFSAFGLRIRM